MEVNKYKQIEKKWQKFWASHPELYHGVDQESQKMKYILVEFPYPSGSGLHIGHAFTFTIGDIYARFKRMQGFNVCFPMGWDAFGLPTENYAIKTKQKPQKVTAENTAAFEEQMNELAFSFDWQRKVDTTDPHYYRWTQWIFIKLFEKGLAHKEEMPINWCPSCKIGLANEEVVNNKCERCGAEVSRRTISQWVVKITDYADKLLEGLEKTNFVEKVKQSQINWIGKSEGAKIRFMINDVRFTNKPLEVFTTRPDTLYGATFMVIAPEHVLVESLKSKEIGDYVSSNRSKSDMERTELNKDKTGVFSGLYAINPMTGKEIPIWISDFVLASYGTGAIMSVPAHDERDWAFAKKFGLPIVPVIQPNTKDFEMTEPYTDVAHGTMINSPEWNGVTPDEAIKRAIDYITSKGFGEATSSYHLRDWIFSRQHYWGEPIPMIYCPACAKASAGKSNAGWVTVPEEQLPLVLPEVEHYEPTDDGKSPLSKIDSFVKTTCPKCGGEAVRETDTMPNWAGSDWYYLGYLLSLKSKVESPKNIFTEQQEKIKQWMPVDVYIGGDEHNTLHLLYSRFIYHFLYDLGVLPNDEPYERRVSHGVILGPDGARMSKSRGNVVVPRTVVDQWGVDITRMYLMFMGPFDGTIAWNENTLLGVKRFIEKFGEFIIHKEVSPASSKVVTLIIHKTMKGLTEDLESFKYNTSIAKLMECLNIISSDQLLISNEDKKNLVKLLAPLAPYMAEELWSQLKSETDSESVHAAAWPVWDENILVEETIVVAIAINGKVRGEVCIDSHLRGNDVEVIKMAKENQKIKPWIDGKILIKEIYIPGKMVNFVIKN